MLALAAPLHLGIVLAIVAGIAAGLTASRAASAVAPARGGRAMTVWIVILAAAAGSYLFRLSMIVLADRYTLPPALERATGFVAPAAFAALAAAGIATACVGVGATQAAAPWRPGRGGHRGAPYRLRLCRDPRRNAGAVDRDRPAAQLIHALERTGANPPMYRTNRSRHDVVIVGGRVAGSATALLLARLGHDVVVVDRALFPSDTLSTHSIARSGVVQLNRWGLLDAVLDSGVPAIRQVAFHAGGEPVTRQLGHKSGVDLLVAPRRYVLDTILATAADLAGATVRTGVTVRPAYSAIAAVGRGGVRARPNRRLG